MSAPPRLRRGVHNKPIWLFPPIELAKEFIQHFKAIRLQQPYSMMVVICLPRLITPGSNYKELVKKYKRILFLSRGNIPIFKIR